MQKKKNNTSEKSDPVVTAGIICRCRTSIFSEIKDYLDLIDGCDVIFLTKSTSNKLWINKL